MYNTMELTKKITDRCDELMAIAWSMIARSWLWIML